MYREILPEWHERGADSSQPKTKLLHILQSNTRLRHLSPRTIAAYVSWVRRHVGYHGLRHSRDVGEAGV